MVSIALNKTTLPAEVKATHHDGRELGLAGSTVVIATNVEGV